MAGAEGAGAYLGIDLGGTKTALAIMDEQGAILAQDVFPTESDHGQEIWIERTADAARRLWPGGVRAVGVGAAGQVDGTGRLVTTANVGGFGNANLGARVGERLGCPGRTDNDAKVELLAEMHQGAAKGARNVFLVAVGTGIGGALAVDGEIYRGMHGFAGEFGHVYIQGAERPCGCGRVGHLETIASGTGIAKSGQEQGIEAAAREGARAVFAAAANGDARARGVLKQAGAVLGGAIAGVVTLFDPDVVVLAGGVADADEGFWQAARQRFAQTVHPTLVETPWKTAALGDKAGAIGACLVARSIA